MSVTLDPVASLEPLPPNAPRVLLGAPVCRSCARRFYPDIRRSPAAQEYDTGQPRATVCPRCQRLAAQHGDVAAGQGALASQRVAAQRLRARIARVRDAAPGVALGGRQ